MQAGEGLGQQRSRTVSFVIPVFNEEGSLGPLHAALAKVVDGLGADMKIIFVDDGSSDQSPKILDALAAADSHVTVVHLRRNYGKAAALDAGFRHARSDVVITLDADLQDDPSEVPRFLDKLDEGYDMVSGWKRIRHDPIDKTFPSAIFNWFVRRVSGLEIHDFNSGFKAYRADCLKDLQIYGELHRYIPALLHWDGFRVCEIEITHHPRTTGQSKFGVGRLFTGAFDLLTVILTSKFRSRPLHFFGYVAIVLGLIGSVALTWLFSLSVLQIEPLHQRPLLYVGLLFILTSVLLLSTGLLGELIKSLHQPSSKPDYFVRLTKSQSEVGLEAGQQSDPCDG
jgi:glycosyltransferase involved in cell wall biosynthesis